MRKPWAIVSILLVVFSLGACAPEVGTKAWCEDMEDRPKGDWTASDAKAFAKHCLLENYTDAED